LCKGHTLLPLDRFFQLDTDRRTRGHSLKIRKPCCHKDIRKYFFSVRVINRWNSLSEDVIQSASVNIFVCLWTAIYTVLCELRLIINKYVKEACGSSWINVRYPDGRIFNNQRLEKGATATYLVSYLVSYIRNAS